MASTDTKTPLTPSQRVLASHARAVAAGGVRISAILPPATVAALDALIASGYAPNRMAAIRRAITEAHERSKPQHGNCAKTT